MNKAAFNIAYETDLNIFEYWKQVRPDLGQRGARAFSGKGFNRGQYLACEGAWACCISPP